MLRVTKETKYTFELFNDASDSVPTRIEEFRDEAEVTAEMLLRHTEKCPQILLDLFAKNEKTANGMVLEVLAHTVTELADILRDATNKG